MSAMLSWAVVASCLVAGNALVVEQVPPEAGGPPDAGKPHVALRHLLQKTCGTAIKKLLSEGKCGHAQPGYLLSCLKDHATDISDSTCLKLSQELKIEDFVKVDGNSTSADEHHGGLFVHCAKERETFCGDVQREHGKKIECLKLHMKDKGFGAECAKALNDREAHATLSKKA